MEILNLIGYALAGIFGAVAGSIVTHFLEKSRQKPKWSTSGITGSFEKRDDGSISRLTLSFDISNNGSVPFSIRHASISIPVPYPDTTDYLDARFQPVDFEPIKLGLGDSKNNLKLIFDIPKGHAINEWGKQITEGGYFKILLRLLDNETSLKQTTVTVFEGGWNNYFDKYNSSIEMYEKIRDGIMESAIIKS